MEFKKVFSVLFSTVVVSMSFLKFGGKCYALPTAENCYSCFENQEQSEIMIKKLNKEDKQILKNMIDEDTDFTKFLGYGVDDFNSDEYLKDLENDCKLVFTIKNKDNEVLGLIFVNESSNENQLNVGYWIGKNFRGNGYVPLALSKMMSKIWQLDKSISFEFWIDDENAASMKAFHKTCNNLKIDPQNSVSKKNTLKIEILSEKIVDNNYFVKTFVNGSLNDTKTVSKQQLLKLYSEDKLKTCVLLKSFASMYSVKSPQLVLENDAELLYTRMTEFLNKNNDVTPEKN